ncbi:MAG: O-sialoglycoprotein endopeptidase [Christensenellales bacterium]|jgi:N6-L-threonylcarbamoyladenine synthase
MKGYLGLDTSMYTTSAAVVDAEGNVLADARLGLQVEDGQRGLRQSEALFQHLKNIPGVLERALACGAEIAAVCVSNAPRPREQSYMPVFLPGVQSARVFAMAKQTPLFYTSHQEGHLMAALSPGFARDFLAVHVSGGTTELLRIAAHGCGWSVELLGATQDLHAGQLIDRIGVALGLPFPSGPALYELSKQATGKIRPPVFVRGLDCGFSGCETALLRLIGAAAPEEIAYAAQWCVAQTLEALLKAGMEKTGLYDVLLFGGVAENLFLREYLSSRVGGVCFAPGGMSKDNAVGVARLGAAQHLEGRNI